MRKAIENNLTRPSSQVLSVMKVITSVVVAPMPLWGSVGCHAFPLSQMKKDVAVCGGSSASGLAIWPPLTVPLSISLIDPWFLFAWLASDSLFISPTTARPPTLLFDHFRQSNLLGFPSVFPGRVYGIFHNKPQDIRRGSGLSESPCYRFKSHIDRTIRFRVRGFPCNNQKATNYCGSVASFVTPHRLPLPPTLQNEFEVDMKPRSLPKLQNVLFAKEEQKIVAAQLPVRKQAPCEEPQTNKNKYCIGAATSSHTSRCWRGGGSVVYAVAVRSQNRRACCRVVRGLDILPSVIRFPGDVVQDPQIERDWRILAPTHVVIQKLSLRRFGK